MADFNKEVATLQTRVIDYCESIRKGELVACKKMQWAVERFLNDLNATNHKNSKYYMDWFEVFKFYRWSQMFKHTKGVLANQHIELHTSQLFEATNIFGFKKRRDGSRRFREVYIQKARKQAKTQTLALIASYIAFLSDEQEEVYIAGWVKEQSNLCYDEILAQIAKVNMLKDKYSDSYRHIRVKSNGSTIKALSREARTTGDGTNPSLSIIDEWGSAHQTREIVDVQKSGMVARREPLMVYITTAGFDLSFPCYSDYQYYSDILNPETDVYNDDIFIAIYELDAGDDIKDERNWVKANPISVTYEQGLDALRSELQVALAQPERMRGFLTKNMNLWVDMKENGFISLEKWNKQTVNVSERDEFLQGAHVYFGIDLSSTTDLTALGWVAVKNGKFMVGQISYMPSGKFKERMSKDKIRFDVFRDRGELVLTDGDVVDYNALKSDLHTLAKKWGCVRVGFDNWNATHISTELQNDGFEMVDIPQSITGLTEATKKFRELIYGKTLFHIDDQLLRWSIGNAVVQQDLNENIKISKSKSKDRIDPVAAIINAFALAMYDDLAVDLNAAIMSDDWSF
ncbi:terminase large subunit [Tuanshanicoccus yangjingiae]|uniref:terminase large subunit n=1 Tax=Aerococcaceae bacterium zg-252 TaxID=2796928 RepID=UPI00406298C9